MKKIKCKHCHEVIPENLWIETEGEWDGEDENGVGQFFYNGIMYCPDCDLPQRISRPYYFGEDGVRTEA